MSVRNTSSIYSRNMSETSAFSPLQLGDLLVLVALLGLHVTEDIQQPLHLRLGFPRLLLVEGHLLLEELHALHVVRVSSRTLLDLHLVGLLEKKHNE